MENKDEKTTKTSQEGRSCYGTGSCGCCGGHRCCAGKAALVLVLLMIGGLIGFGIGRCHSGHGHCYYPMHCPMSSTDVQPTK